MSNNKTLSKNGLDNSKTVDKIGSAEHLDKILGSFDVNTSVRDGIEQNKMLGFEHIVDVPMYKERFDFRIENDDKGQIQKLMQKGWRVATGSVFPEVDMNKKFDLNEGSRDKSESVASVSVGVGSDGTPMKAFLMFAPKGTNQKLQDLMHKENAERKKSLGHIAQEKAMQKSMNSAGSNPGTYTPEGTDGGFSNMSRGPINQVTST